MSLTTCDQCPLPILVFDNQSWNEVHLQTRQYVVIAALPCALYGIFVLLCGASIYSLVKLSTRNRRTTLILSLALVVLFCSTTLYTVARFLDMLDRIFDQIINAVFDLWDYPYPVDDASVPLLESGSRNVGFRHCSPTAALTINVLIEDAIVCWRACVVWRSNRIVMGACIMLLLTTFAMGTVDTTYDCSFFTSRDPSWGLDPHADGDGSLYQGFSYGVAATVLSLGTNLFATIGVAVKAWQLRRALKPYVTVGSMASQIEKVFSLIVESGVIYCTLWVVVLAYQAGSYKEISWTVGDNSFGDIFTVFLNSALVPIVAIYPTIVIVLVALNRSHIENGLRKTGQNIASTLPVPPLAVAVNTTVTTRFDNQHRGICEGVLVICGENSSTQDGSEGSSTLIAEELKNGDIVY